MAGLSDRLRRLFVRESEKSEQPKAPLRLDLQIVQGFAWNQDVEWIVVPMDDQGPERVATLESQGRAVVKINPPACDELASAYRMVLGSAQSNGIRSVAFPRLWAGLPDCDEAEALKTALDAVASFLNELPSATLERVVFAMG